MASDFLGSTSIRYQIIFLLLLITHIYKFLVLNFYLYILFHEILIFKDYQKVKLSKGLPKYYTGGSKNVVTDNIIMFCQSETTQYFTFFISLEKPLKINIS
jgi:hypothetical protein